MTSEQADAMIELLREIRDELAAPRLHREHLEREQQKQFAKHHDRLAAARAADEAARAEHEKTSLRVGGVGILTVRQGPAP